MKEALFMVADVWAIVVGFTYGIKFIRKHHNYLLGLEWIVVATSCTNFLLFAATKSSHDSVLYTIASFFDAFSRSIGITLILVLGLMQVTHRYKPTLPVEIGSFALAAVFGFLLVGYQESAYATPIKIFFIVVNVLTSIFLIYFAARLWRIGEHTHAIWAGISTFCSFLIAAIYDFVRIPGDDAEHTIFYTLALASWGLQMLVFYRAYDAFAAHNARVDAGAVSAAPARA